MKPNPQPIKSVLVSALSALVLLVHPTGLPAASPEQDARRAAQRDIASGNLKVYVAGTIASHLVGVDLGELALVRGLPVDHSLSRGCTDPGAREHIAYASAYNQEIVGYLRTHPER